MAASTTTSASRAYFAVQHSSQHEPSSWRQVASEKKIQREASVSAWSVKIFGKSCPNLPDQSHHVRDWPLQSGQLSQKQMEITQAIPSLLLHNIATSLWSAEEVLVAFIARTIIAHHLTNPLTEVFFDDGMERARTLDEHLRRTGSTVGPLHGLPISLKDVMNLQGQATTLGFVALASNVAEESDDLVQHLGAAGAIFYCKTNVPQSLMSGECVNLLYGTTSTPDNTNLSAGGSSGGEGSLIALGGSPLGIGTDIAGSIRTPANFNGVYGLCPSYGRLPLHSAKFTKSNHLINGVAGPLCRSIDGLEVYIRAVLSTDPWNWDSTCIRMPWDQSAYDETLRMGSSGELCFGFIHHDGVVRPHSPIQRGMREVKEALEKAGHNVVDVDLFDGTEGLWEQALRIFCSTGGREIKSLVTRLPEPFAKTIMIPSASQTLTAQELQEEGNNLLRIRQRFLQKWRETSLVTPTKKPVDVFILPSGGHVAPPHGTMEYFLYEAISNILDWTCATIPVGRVDAVLDPKPTTSSTFLPMSEWDARNWEKYSPEVYKDAAICLQVMGQRLTEEKVLAALGIVNEALGRERDHMV
ncbi:unnamed protein product [Fusarium equiseti]|uniref:amidase n=1 Tax=Fusarium equiseti TaxID=61235 RepID=A0A8J2JBR0_FUSEQ|nr:unnamed protein product [Fusarium equiseti]